MVETTLWLHNVAADRGLEIKPHVTVVPTHESPATVALDHLVLVERVVVVRSAVAPTSSLLDGPPRRRPITIDPYDAAVHLLHEELHRVQQFEELSRDAP